MKEYNKMDGIRKQMNELLDVAFDKGYKQRAEDDESHNDYKQGLNDAWECARKIFLDEVDGGLRYETLEKIFNPHFLIPEDALKDYSVEQVIKRIREYEETHKPERPCNSCKYLQVNKYGNEFCTEVQYYDDRCWQPKQIDDEIHVGDEVILYGTERKGVVTQIFKNGVGEKMYRCVNLEGDLSTEKEVQKPIKTGRHFDQIEEVLREMRGE